MLFFGVWKSFALSRTEIPDSFNSSVQTGNPSSISLLRQIGALGGDCTQIHLDRPTIDLGRDVFYVLNYRGVNW